MEVVVGMVAVMVLKAVTEVLVLSAVRCCGWADDGGRGAKGRCGQSCKGKLESMFILARRRHS